MHELFLAICLATTLSCSDVNLHRQHVGVNTLAAAAIDIYGEYHIIVSDDVTDSDMKRILVHEIAHLLVFEIDPTYTSHGDLYDSICEKLARQNDLTPGKTCVNAGIGHSYWNPRAHYKRDE